MKIVIEIPANCEFKKSLIAQIIASDTLVNGISEHGLKVSVISGTEHLNNKFRKHKKDQHHKNGNFPMDKPEQELFNPERSC